jgi:hypothetical protein
MRVSTGEAWDIPIERGNGFSSTVVAWLPDSSGLIYRPSGKDELRVARVAGRTVRTLYASKADKSLMRQALLSHDGRTVAVDVAASECRRGTRSGRCLVFVDVATGDVVSSRMFPEGSTAVGSGPEGLQAWLSDGLLAFIGPITKDPWRVLWLAPFSAESGPAIWPEDVPGEGDMPVIASPDGQYAIVMAPNGQYFAGAPRWDAKVYRLPAAIP